MRAMSVKAVIRGKQYACMLLLLCGELLLDAAFKPKLHFKVGELVFHSCSGLFEIDSPGLFVWCGTSGT